MKRRADETQHDRPSNPNATWLPQLQDDCCGILFGPGTGEQKLDDDWDNVSGRLVLDYMYSDDHMVYGSISNGYKSGGFRLGTLSDNPYFDEETVLAYEIGYKGTFNDTLQINAAAYFYDYTRYAGTGCRV